MKKTEEIFALIDRAITTETPTTSLFCKSCGVCLDQHPVYFACNEIGDAWYCHDCWCGTDRAQVCAAAAAAEHGEGCETVVFNCPMGDKK